MARQFKNNVSLEMVEGSKKLYIVEDEGGKFNKDNVDELYALMVKAIKEQGGIYSFFKPTVDGDTPVLLTKWNKPYIALLPKREIAGPVKQIRIKLG